MSFKEQFKKEREAHIRSANHVLRLAAVEAVNYAITSAAVGNPDLWASKYHPKGYVGGTFRSSLFLTKTKPSVRVPTEIRPAGSIIQEYTSRIMSEYSDKWILASNIPYAKPLDNGHSKQMPNGLTAPTALHVNSKIPELTRIANQKYGIS